MLLDNNKVNLNLSVSNTKTPINLNNYSKEFLDYTDKYFIFRILSGEVSADSVKYYKMKNSFDTKTFLVKSNKTIGRNFTYDDFLKTLISTENNKSNL